VTARLTTHVANDWFPVWSPDGQQLLFGSDRAGGTATPPYLKESIDVSGTEAAVPTPVPGSPLDWSRVGELRVARAAFWEDIIPDPEPKGDGAGRLRIAARHAWTRHNLPQACASWFAQPEAPVSHADRLLVAECLADGRDPRAPQYAAQLAGEQPIETDLALATWLANSGRPREAGERLLAALAAYRNDPWVYRPLVRRTLPVAVRLAREDRALAPRLYEAFSHPFAVDMFQQPRLLSRIWITRALDAENLCVDAISPLEPHVPWEGPFLNYRYQCYRRQHNPLAARARRDLETFLADAPPRLAEGLGQ